jgi:hypothetical protein
MLRLPVSGHHLLGADRLPRCRPSGTLAFAPASSPGAADRVRTPRDTKAGPRRNIEGDLLLGKPAHQALADRLQAFGSKQERPPG